MSVDIELGAPLAVVYGPSPTGSVGSGSVGPLNLPTKADEKARIDNDVNLSVTLVAAKPSLKSTAVLVRARALQYAHSTASARADYETNPILRATLNTQIRDLETAYRAAGGTGVTDIPLVSGPSWTDTVSDTVGGAGALVALGGLGLLGYFLMRGRR